MDIISVAGVQWNSDVVFILLSIVITIFVIDKLVIAESRDKERFSLKQKCLLAFGLYFDRHSLAFMKAIKQFYHRKY